MQDWIGDFETLIRQTWFEFWSGLASRLSTSRHRITDLCSSISRDCTTKFQFSFHLKVYSSLENELNVTSARGTRKQALIVGKWKNFFLPHHSTVCRTHSRLRRRQHGLHTQSTLFNSRSCMGALPRRFLLPPSPNDRTFLPTCLNQIYQLKCLNIYAQAWMNLFSKLFSEIGIFLNSNEGMLRKSWIVFYSALNLLRNQLTDLSPI